MPVHNAGQYLSDALESVIADLPASAELVVVDDGSTDDALINLPRTLLDRDNVVLLTNDRCEGISAALNRAIRYGDPPEFIAIAEHDDLVVQGRFAEQVAFLVRNPQVAVVSGLGTYLSPTGKTMGLISTGPQSEHEFLIAKRAGEPVLVLHPCATFRFAALLEAGFYDSSFDGAQDLELMNRIVYSHGWSLQTLPSIHVHYRVHPGAASFERFRTQRMIARFVRSRNYSLLRKEPCPSYAEWLNSTKNGIRRRLRWMRHDRGAMLFRQAGMYWLAGKRIRALAPATGAAILHPGWVLGKLRRQLTAVSIQ